MKKLQSLFYLTFITVMLSSCTKDEVAEKKPVDPVQAVENEVKRFIYRGLNDYYLYKADVPVLGNNYFSAVSEKNDYLEAAGSPEDLFETLLAPQDEFSFMFADYIKLENLFKGISTTNGMDLGYGKFSNSNGVFAWVRYVLPGSSAEEKGIQRGDIFTTVDGVQMNVNNYLDLLDKETYTITLASISDNTLSQTEETVTLEKEVLDENPVHIAKVIETGGKNIGYLMYNSFTANYDDKLNETFAQFKSAGVTDLILDLRYNGGGDVLTATRLASMITGQFTGEVFMKEQWNKKWQAIYQQNYPEYLVNKFTDTIDAGQPLNSLFLDQVYVLATGSSASASELILNGLEPYIDVVHVGTTTTGKFQASVTLYDSPKFRREGASDNHAYVIQPLVLKSVNAAGKTDYVDGLTPDIMVEEKLADLGTLGDPSETLLNAAIDQIIGATSKKAYTEGQFPEFEFLGESGMDELNYQKMYIDKIPVLPENQ